MYLATIKPSSISVRYEADPRPVVDRIFDKMLSTKQYKNLHRTKSSFALSPQSKRKLYNSIQFLSSVSKPRTIEVAKGKFLYNFKTSFATLTLPAKQMHSDKEIKQCLNIFLTNLRTKFDLHNYVWKAELQGNENIHFHLVFDKYIHHKAVRYYWNLALENLGYITAYAQEWSGLSLREYAEKRGISIQKAIPGFRHGVATKWRNPGTEQIVKTRNDNQLGYYVQKYMSKAGTGTIEKNGTAKAVISISELVRVRNFGRVWGRSQSLSKIKFINRWDWDSLREKLCSFIGGLSNFIKKEYEYCTTYYLSRSSDLSVKKWFQRHMREHANDWGYIFPT